MGTNARGLARRVGAVALSAALALGLCGCKPTDFFTEVVIAPWATEVDEDNPDKVTVNSPDAAEETDQLPALDWTDASSVSREVSNLVVYGSEPTTTLTTHHSIFDLEPRFPGIEASDGVRLTYADDSTLDHEADANEDDESSPEAESTSTGGAASAASASESPSDQAEETTTTVQSTEGASIGEGGSSGEGEAEGSSGDEGAVGSDQGSSDGGELGNPDSSDGSGGEGEGETPQPSTGADGTVDVWDPNNALAQVQHADKLAVIGTNAAVLVQAIGGEGSICAMSSYAWNGLDASGADSACASCFNEVFSDELEGIQLLWSGDGSDSSDLLSVDALVEACGEGGVIVYDQTLGDQTTFFDGEQRSALQEAGIQLVPVELSTTEGIVDAATVIGDALSESETCANDSQAWAEAYIQVMKGIVNAAAATAPSSSLVTCVIATEAESGLSYDNDYGIDSTGVVLFTNLYARMYTPLSTWSSAINLSISPHADSNVAYTGTTYNSELELLWPLGITPTATTTVSNLTLTEDTLKGGTAGDARSRWLSSEKGSKTWVMTTEVSSQIDEAGLGSAYMPYLVVCASDLDGDGDSTTDEVKEAVVDSMMSYSNGGALTPYSVLDCGAQGTVWAWLPYDSATGLSSAIGYQGYKAVSGASGTNPFLSGYDVENAVRESPVGLLGGWDEASMESVLMTVWLADLYSHEADGCEYEAEWDMSQFSLTVDGTTYKSLEDVTKWFYQTFYRLDDSQLEAAWQNAVPDTFEGLE